MDFAPSARSQELQDAVRGFLADAVYPAEPLFHQQVAQNREEGSPFQTPAVMQRLKAQARERGLWNLFLPDQKFGAGLPVLDYAPLAELSGRAIELAPEAMNCAAPTPETWRCWRCSAPPSSSNDGWSPCWRATSARASR